MTLEWKFNTIPNSTKTYLLSSFFFLVLDAECFLPCLFNWFSCEVFLGICKFRYRAVMTRSTQWYLAAGAEGFSGPIWFGLSNVFIQLHSTRKYSWCLSWATEIPLAHWAGPTPSIVRVCHPDSISSSTIPYKSKLLSLGLLQEVQMNWPTQTLSASPNPFFFKV